eukprot:m.43332 g.43332  ORF g.43332 m.43332 type:complete len:68 (+) comp6152_c0_seq1:1789-1992(+)
MTCPSPFFFLFLAPKQICLHNRGCFLRDARESISVGSAGHSACGQILAEAYLQSERRAPPTAAHGAA